MIISIDFDQTYTADKDMWDKVIKTFKEFDHTVYCVTCRSDWDIAGIDRISNIVDAVFFTDNKPKIEFMEEAGYHIDIWIDDTPATVTGGGKVMYKK